MCACACRAASITVGAAPKGMRPGSPQWWRPLASRVRNALYWRAARVQQHWLLDRALPRGRRLGDVPAFLRRFGYERVEGLADLLGMSPSEVVGNLYLPRPATTVRLPAGPSIALRPGTADPLTLLDTLGHGYHRSVWQLPPNPLIVDLGCNIGLTLLDYGLTFPSATIVGVEMDPANAELARQNALPLGSRCVVHTAALTTHSGLVGYRGDETANFAYAIDPAGSMTADGITMGDLLRTLGYRRIDLLKVDIEGHERDLLTSDSAQAWAGYIDRITIEVHAPWIVSECMLALKRLGFDTRLNPARHGGVLAERCAFPHP